MEEKSNQNKSSRREFLSKLFMGSGLVASMLLLVKHGLAYIVPSIEEPKDRKLLVGRLDELNEGEAKEFTIGEKTLFMVNTGGELKVLDAACSHLGCKLRWENHRNRFFCACHQGIFSPDGRVVSGPPPRPMEEYKVEVVKNLVYMWIKDTSGGAA